MRISFPGKSVAFILIAVFLTSVAAKGRLGNYYPDKFKKYGAKDWPLLKRNLEQIVELKSTQLVEESGRQTVSRRRTAEYTLARLNDIHWQSEQRKKIGKYLCQWIRKLLFEKSLAILPDNMYKKICGPAGNTVHTIFLPAVGVRSLFAINLSKGCSCVEQLFPRLGEQDNRYSQHMRLTILNVLHKYVASDAVGELLEELTSQQYEFSEREKREIGEMLTRRELLTHDDQRKSWEWLWSKFERKSIDAAVTRRAQFRWYYNINHMEFAYESVDPAIPFSIMTSTEESLTKRYIFGYVTAWVFNVGSNRELSDADLKMYRKIRQAYNDIRRLMKKEHPELDLGFLAGTMESLTQSVAEAKSKKGN